MLIALLAVLGVDLSVIVALMANRLPWIAACSLASFSGRRYATTPTIHPA
jgi:hypothetical protein